MLDAVSQGSADFQLEFSPATRRGTREFGAGRQVFGCISKPLKTNTLGVRPAPRSHSGLQDRSMATIVVPSAVSTPRHRCLLTLDSMSHNIENVVILAL